MKKNCLSLSTYVQLARRVGYGIRAIYEVARISDGRCQKRKFHLSSPRTLVICQEYSFFTSQKLRCISQIELGMAFALIEGHFSRVCSEKKTLVRWIYDRLRLIVVS